MLAEDVDGNGAFPERPGNSPRRVLFASLIGTAIEFFDFYIYATAAVLVFPKLFFPASDPTSATLQSLATFALALLRSSGRLRACSVTSAIASACKATLVAAFLTMGIRPSRSASCPVRVPSACWRPSCSRSVSFRSGASASAANGAAQSCSPPRTRRLARRRSTACSLSSARRWVSCARPVSSSALTEELELISSSSTSASGFPSRELLLVFVGLYVRLRLTETPAFQHAIENNERVRVPIVTLVAEHPASWCSALSRPWRPSCLFYLMTVFR